MCDDQPRQHATRRYEKRRRKADIEASVAKHPKIRSFFTAASSLVTADQFPSEPSSLHLTILFSLSLIMSLRSVAAVLHSLHTEALPFIEDNEESLQVLS